MNKIKENELKQLKNLQLKTQKIIIKLGEISFNEILLKDDKKNAEQELKEIRDEEKTLNEFLIKTYGDKINIDLESGEF